MAIRNVHRAWFIKKPQQQHQQHCGNKFAKNDREHFEHCESIPLHNTFHIAIYKYKKELAQSKRSIIINITDANIDTYVFIIIINYFFFRRCFPSVWAQKYSIPFICQLSQIYGLFFMCSFDSLIALLPKIHICSLFLIFFFLSLHYWWFVLIVLASFSVLLINQFYLLKEKKISLSSCVTIIRRAI